MKNTLNYWVFFVMGLLSEAILLVLAFNIVKIAYSIDMVVNFLVVGGYFMVYRFFADWRYFGENKRGEFLNHLSKEFRHPLVRKNITFPAFMALLMITANWQFYGLIPLTQLWVWCLVSSLGAWWTIDLFRLARLKLSHSYAYDVEKTGEVTEWRTS